MEVLSSRAIPAPAKPGTRILRGIGTAQLPAAANPDNRAVRERLN
jgi:hypothetical protein